jgi:hypothetical protein
MDDTDEILDRISALRHKLDVCTREVSRIYNDLDLGKIDGGFAEEQLANTRRTIHEVALDLSDQFFELNNALEFGGTLPSAWREARRPIF